MAQIRIEDLPGAEAHVDGELADDQLESVAGGATTFYSLYDSKYLIASLPPLTLPGGSIAGVRA